jgi:glycosyltransferase involved in cell wall biosynthesis
MLGDGYVSRHILTVTKALDAEYPALIGSGRASRPESDVEAPAVSLRQLSLVRAVSPVHDVRALSQLRRLIAVERPWLVETHMAKAGTLGRLAALTSRWRPKTVHTFHIHALRDYFRASPTTMFLEIERRLARQTDRLVALSPQTRDECLDLGIGEVTQWRVVPFASQPGRPRVLRTSLGIPDDAFVVGIFFCREHDTDGTTLMEAIRLVPGLHLVVRGDGDRPKLEEQARVASIEGRVHFAGWSAEIPGAMADADLMMLSNCPLHAQVQLRDAASLGCPVVTTGDRDVAAAASEGAVGVRVRPDDPSALASSIREMRHNERWRRELRAKAWSSAAAPTLEPTLAALRELYGELGNLSSA